MNQPKASNEQLRPDDVIDETIADLDNQHNRLVEQAAEVGYARDLLIAAKPLWTRLADETAGSASPPAVYSSGVSLLCAYRDEVRANARVVVGIEGPNRSLLNSAVQLCAATGSTASFSVTTFGAVAPPPATHTPERHEECARRLAQLDESLAKTYRAIWELLYATRQDPVRAALWEVRQAFDHLFSLLSPDDVVRLSEYWVRKTAIEAPDRVTRSERLAYAAHTWATTPERKETLLVATEHMIDVYQRLNIAHQRGHLDEPKARAALNEMLSLLESWAYAIDLASVYARLPHHPPRPRTD